MVVTASETYRVLVEHAADIIAILDAAGTVRYVTASVERILGYPPEELIGRDVLDAVHPHDRESAEATFAVVLRTPGAYPLIECRIPHRDGSWRYLGVSVNNLLAEPSVQGIVVTGRDITNRKQVEEQLRHRASHDPLTGLANRVTLVERLDHALHRRTPPAGAVAVLFLDVDDLKAVNDTHGHAAGDAMLVTLAERLRMCVRTSDTVARFGGDEFVVLLEDLADAAQAREVAERIANVVADPVAAAGQQVAISVSIGIGLAASEGTEPAALLRAADTALYQAKAAGKGQVAVFGGAG